jgi:hypothetical protein
MANQLSTRRNPVIDAVFETSGIRGMARWHAEWASLV